MDKRKARNIPGLKAAGWITALAGLALTSVGVVNAQGQGQTQGQTQGPAQAAGAPLTGVWSNGSPTLLQHVNAATATLLPGYGFGANYEFYPDGTYRYAQMVSSGKDPCITTSFLYQEGVISVNASTITFHSKRNIASNAGCGSALSRNESGPKDDTFPFVFGKDPRHGNRPAIKVGAVVFLKNK
jgi:hypothetical protein